MAHHANTCTHACQHHRLYTSQGVPALDALLRRYATVVHPHTYDCRDCGQSYNHCPQQMIDLGQGGRVWTLFNGCSDSRAQPGAVFEPHAGDMFPITAAGALLTPYDKDGGTNNAWGSIEYAVSHLGVRDLVQFGHTECGAMQGLVAMAKGAAIHGQHLKVMLQDVMDIEKGAEEWFMQEHNRQPDAKELQRALEYHNVRVAVHRLRAFVEACHPDKTIRVHGWIYDMRGANILALQPNGHFKPITDLPHRVDYGHLPASCEQGMAEIDDRLVYRDDADSAVQAAQLMAVEAA